MYKYDISLLASFAFLQLEHVMKSREGRNRFLARASFFSSPSPLLLQSDSEELHNHLQSCSLVPRLLPPTPHADSSVLLHLDLSPFQSTRLASATPQDNPCPLTNLSRTVAPSLPILE